jgi:hypothetical protein
MYVDLLTQALGECEEGRRSEDLLLADLARSRARLRAGRTKVPVHEALAREVSYDGALIRLCRSLSLQAEPGCFADPPRARARLERALSEHGFSLPPVAEPQLQPA